MIIQFSKPTHWNEDNTKCWINLDYRKVEQAKKNKEEIIIELPQGLCKPVNPKDLLEYGKRVEAVYLYPNNPMRLLGSYFTLMDKSTEERLRERDLIAATM